jgi:hypothetical protein
MGVLPLVPMVHLQRTKVDGFTKFGDLIMFSYHGWFGIALFTFFISSRMMARATSLISFRLTL